MFGKIVRYKDDEYNVEIVVKRASVLAGTKLYLMRQRQVEYLQQQQPAMTQVDGVVSIPDYLMAEFMSRTSTYPMCVAGTHTIRNLWSKEELANNEERENEEGELFAAPRILTTEISIEDFLQLPAELVDMWFMAVLDVNPGWQIVTTEERGEKTPEGEPMGEESAPSDADGSTES